MILDNENLITEARLEKFRKVANVRQKMTVILENVHDPHNIGAVMRSCDAVGIQELYIIYTDKRLDEEHFEIGTKSASSAKKWLDTYFFKSWEKLNAAIRNKYDRILATHLTESSKSIYNTTLTDNIAFLFGNEKEGISNEALSYIDQNILIPQYGLVQSLNISVACAVTLYEALRQRHKDGLYNSDLELKDSAVDVYQGFINKHNAKFLPDEH